jgi:hypothetical protein
LIDLTHIRRALRSGPVLLALASSVSLSGLGCGGHENATKTSTTMLTAATPLDNESAVLRVAHARCDHAIACNRVGEDKTYATRDECMQKMSYHARGDLRSSACEGGVREHDLDDCVREIENQPCGSSSDLSPRSACDRSKLCSF